MTTYTAAVTLRIGFDAEGDSLEEAKRNADDAVLRLMEHLEYGGFRADATEEHCEVSEEEE